MKYFTHELLAECRALNPDIAEAAAVKWRLRAEAYRKRLQQIRERLPSGVRHLIRSVTLHDAHPFSVYAKVRGQPNFVLSFQLPGGDGRTGVQLQYDGVERVELVAHDTKATGGTELFALYNEFDVSQQGIVTHSILMTAGIELRIRFTKLIVTPLTKIIALGRGRSAIEDQLAEMADSWRTAAAGGRG